MAYKVKNEVFFRERTTISFSQIIELELPLDQSLAIQRVVIGLEKHQKAAVAVNKKLREKYNMDKKDKAGEPTHTEAEEEAYEKEFDELCEKVFNFQEEKVTLPMKKWAEELKAMEKRKKPEEELIVERLKRIVFIKPRILIDLRDFLTIA